jgi:uncharacterized protein YjiK
MKQFINIAIAFWGATILALSNCRQPDEKDVMLKNYNLAKPEKFFMPESLLEISGLTFYKGKSDTVYAINDEEGKLFRLAWKVKKQYNAKFGKKGDYEDLAIVNDKVVVLKSNGRLFLFSFQEAHEEDIASVAELGNLLPEGEYEAMYGDESSGQLYVICKNCKADDPKNIISGFIFRMGDAVYPTGTFQLDVKAIESLAGKIRRGFQPSALARNPVTGEWFIVSGLNKLLVIADSDWKIKETYPLSGNTFNQPEGIAFDNEGNLFISNEGDDLSDGTILKFKRLEHE